MREMQLFLAGSWQEGPETYEVCSPWDGRSVSRVARGGEAELERATEAAVSASPLMAALDPADRATILDTVAGQLLRRKEEIAAILVEEAGKPLSLARIEVERCADTFSESAAVARHPIVEARDLGGFGSGRGRLALIRRVPVGPVLAVTPFNFPLNLVAHKLAPAVAAGCPVVLKPATQTPSPALVLAELLNRAGLPQGGLSVIPSRGAAVEPLVADSRFAFVTFTGSMDVGWRLKKLGWKRRVTLEMGGNAAVVVEPDAGDLGTVAARIVSAAYGYAGQSCISVQRILVHRTIHEPLRRALLEAIDELEVGDPARERTLCGPVIDKPNAARIETWIWSALQAGGTLLTGGERRGNLIQPTLLEDVPADEPVVADEVFGPVATLSSYDNFEQALAMVNDSRYGLQAGLYTNDLGKVQRAWQVLEVGGLIQGDVPTWRTDPMPYGGVKNSGVGREGPEFTWREMTEERLLVIRR